MSALESLFNVPPNPNASAEHAPVEYDARPLWAKLEYLAGAVDARRMYRDTEGKMEWVVGRLEQLAKEVFEEYERTGVVR